MKKILPLFAFAPLASFAEGEQSDALMQSVSGAMDTWADKVEGFLTTATPYLLGLLGLGVAITALWIGWKLFRRGTSKIG